VSHLLSDGAAMGVPENVRLSQACSVQHRHRQGGELGYGQGSDRRRAATDAGASKLTTVRPFSSELKGPQLCSGRDKPLTSNSGSPLP